MNKKIRFYVLFLIGIVLIFSRFLYLDRFPIGISHDELEYILSAKTYFSSGVDLSNTPFPKSIFQTKTEGVISFLPAIVLSPYYGLVPLNQFTARLPYLIISLLTGITICFITKKLFNNKSLSIVTLLVYLVNPWSFYLSRFACDTPLALLFYLLGILFCLNSKNKFFLSFLFFTLGFFSYHGAKPLLIPLVMVCVIYRCYLSKNKLNIKKIGIFLGGIVLVFSFYILSSFLFPESINQSRSQDIIFLNQKLITPIVDGERKETIETPFKNIFINKATITLRIFAQKYLTAFSPDVLFILGDTYGTYRFGNHGLFFIIDFVFILMGLINLFKKYPNKTMFLLMLVLISPLTTAISTVETSVVNRSFLLLPLLVIFSAYGIFTVYRFISIYLNQVVSFVVLSLIVLISFINFCHFYFFQFPIVGQENFFFSHRIVGNYIQRNNDYKTVVVDNEPREVFLEAVFYSKNKNQNLVLKDFVKNQKFVLGNTSFTDKCPESFDKDTVYIINRAKEQCLPKDKVFLSINEEQYGGPLYYIINDSLCSSFPSQRWLRFHLIKDYLPEKLDNSTFCQTWIKQTQP